MSKRLEFESNINSDETKEFLDAISKKFEEKFMGRDIIFESELNEFWCECLGIEHGHPFQTFRGIIKVTRDE